MLRPQNCTEGQKQRKLFVWPSSYTAGTRTWTWTRTRSEPDSESGRRETRCTICPPKLRPLLFFALLDLFNNNWADGEIKEEEEEEKRTGSQFSDVFQISGSPGCSDGLRKLQREGQHVPEWREEEQR